MAMAHPLSGGPVEPPHDSLNTIENDDDEHDETLPLAAAADIQSSSTDLSSSSSNNNLWIREGHRRVRSHRVHASMRHMTLVAALGGFLFGYDTGVISGALLPIARRFHFSTHWEPQLLVSSTVLAAAVGSLCVGGAGSANLGRKPIMLAAAAIIGTGSILLASAFHYPTLIVGRLVIGIGIGMASMTTPLYIAEVAMPTWRGRLVTVNAFMVTLGQFSAGMVDGVLDAAWPDQGGWRWMLGLAVLPAVMMLYGLWALPESPRWLAMTGRPQQAMQVLVACRESDREATLELQEILESLSVGSNSDKERATVVKDNHKDYWGNTQEPDYGTATTDDSETMELPGGTGGALHATTAASAALVPRLHDEPPIHSRLLAVLSDAPTRRALGLGCGLMVVQQCSGINTVMYYAATIYKMSEFSETTAVWLSGFTALAQVLGIAVSIWLVDRVGRRELVLGSLGAVAVSLAGLGLSFYWTRLSSERVIHSVGRCGYQPSLLGSGHTEYCYDCTGIDGCGFCGGQCVPGDFRAPFQMDACSDGSEWAYEVCSNRYGPLSAFFMIAYLFSFGIGMGGLPWTINSEIYPLRHRSLCVSISTAVNWIGNLLVAATFLSLSSPSLLTIYGAFWMYGCIAILGFVWLYLALPETKGLHLEEIVRLFERQSDQYHVVSEEEHLGLAPQSSRDDEDPEHES